MSAEWQEGVPEPDSPSDLIHEIHDLVASIDHRREAGLSGLGLDGGQAQVLEALGGAEAGRLTAGELSRRCGVTAGATTQRVTRLERLGLVQRTREEPDRRTVHVALTAAGRERLAAVSERRVRTDDDICAGLHDEDRRELRRLVGSWRRRLGPS